MSRHYSAETPLGRRLRGPEPVREIQQQIRQAKIALRILVASRLVTDRDSVFMAEVKAAKAKVSELLVQGRAIRERKTKL